MGGVEHATPGMVLIMVVITAPLFVFIAKAKRGVPFFVRHIPGIDAINNAVGRAAELERPVSFSTGLTGVGPVLYAVLGVLFHVARRCSIYGSRLIVPQVSSEVMAITEDVIKDAYRVEGKMHEFDPSSVIYLSDEQFAFASGYMGVIQRENVGSAFLFGSFAAESLIMAEAGQQVGAMQVAASVSPEQVPFFITSCDYTLIGEELYAAAAYLTKEPVQLGSLYAQDRAKLAIFALIIMGVAFATVEVFYPELNLPDITDWIMRGWEAFG
ncbi:MAG: hypothetical protein D6808_01090 [Candidatus Dadabacteria bacterium]|nr:MAG: hypothetical protein D6808_01090 [Candidatus Dadabacteria bacterium]